MIFISKNVSTISADTNYLNNDWAPILNKVKDKKIVLLGEFNHGSKEVFTTRNDLIRELHEQYDFNVILFESGIGEIAHIEINKDSLFEKQLLSGFFSGWRTHEFLDLMQFIKSKNLSIAGFDVQRTGNNFSSLFSNTEEELELPSLNYLHLEKRFSEVKKSYLITKLLLMKLNLKQSHLLMIMLVFVIY